MWTKLAILLFIIAFGIAGYSYYWYSGIVNRERKAQAVLSEIQILREKNNLYKRASEAISAENDRCRVFITQKEGDFGSFEYCKKFIQWVKNVPLK